MEQMNIFTEYELEYENVYPDTDTESTQIHYTSPICGSFANKLEMMEINMKEMERKLRNFPGRNNNKQLLMILESLMIYGGVMDSHYANIIAVMITKAYESHLDYFVDFMYLGARVDEINNEILNYHSKKYNFDLTYYYDRVNIQILECNKLIVLLNKLTTQSYEYINEINKKIPFVNSFLRKEEEVSTADNITPLINRIYSLNFESRGKNQLRKKKHLMRKSEDETKKKYLKYLWSLDQHKVKAKYSNKAVLLKGGRNVVFPESVMEFDELCVAVFGKSGFIKRKRALG